MSRALQIPLDIKVKELPELPYTLSYVIRKRQQIDNLMELPKDKQPPDDMIWDGNSEDIEDWLDKVLYKQQPVRNEWIIDDVEG